MEAHLRPLWVFAPIFAAFAVSSGFRGASDGFQAGLVFSGFLALRFREKLSVRRLFPIFMLFLFLLGLGHTPSRDFVPTLSFTAEALIALRLLLLVLGGIQTRTRPVSPGTKVLVLGLILEALVSAGLAVSTFRLFDPRILQGLHLTHLRVFVAAAAMEFLWRRLSR
jgi:hypothetical protein